jgi:hypothetical protein
MLRDLLIIFLGTLICFLATAEGDYFPYKVGRSTGWPEPQLAAIGRYILSPVIAVVIGAVIGGVAKRRASVLAIESPSPSDGVVVFQTMDFRHEIILVSLGIFYVLKHRP